MITRDKKIRTALTYLAFTSSLCVFSMTASAMLPTPEPEMMTSNTTQSAVATQATAPQPLFPIVVPSSPQPVSIASHSNESNYSSDGNVQQQAPLHSTNQGVVTKTVALLMKTDDQGQIVSKPVDVNTRLSSGDVVEYRTYVINNSPNRVRTLTLTTSIPSEVVLIGNVSPTQAFASVDGSLFSRYPLKSRVDGQLQPIPLTYYTQLRWTLQDIDLGASSVVAYRARVK